MRADATAPRKWPHNLADLAPTPQAGSVHRHRLHGARRIRRADRAGVAILFVVLPLLVGLFYGAPLVAREIEYGTHRFVWTQGVSRRHWALRSQPCWQWFTRSAGSSLCGS
jgi:plasmid stabilization system protein ParE